MPESNNLISIILPVYNAAAHLRPCLDSILAQSHTNFELVCINDGSADDSLEILNEYAAHDSRITVLDQENAGAGATRNRGLDLAQGSYLSFLDSDDIFEPNMLADAHRVCKQKQADFCLFDSDCFDSESNKYFKTVFSINKDLLPLHLATFSFRNIKEDHFSSMLGWAWDKLYRTNFIRSNNIRFLEQHNSEDMYFAFDALVKAERITIVDKVLAHQRMGHSTSLSVSRGAHPFDFFAALLALKEKLLDCNLFDELERSFVTYALQYSLWNLATLPSKPFELTYNMLKSEGFEQLGLVDQPVEYFFSTSDFEKWQKIKESDAIGYLQSELLRLRAQQEALIRKVPFGLGNKLVSWYQKRSG